MNLRVLEFYLLNIKAVYTFEPASQEEIVVRNSGTGSGQNFNNSDHCIEVEQARKKSLLRIEH